MPDSNREYENKWFILVAAGLGVFLATIDGSIVNVALPTLVKALNADFSTVQWVVLAYLLTVTTLMLGIGRISDMIGKKQIFTLGFIIFTTGSVLCGLSGSVYTLIAYRVIQAIGASMIIALGVAIVTEAFPPAERGMAIGINGAVVSVGIVVGPTLGGLLIDALSWHWIFLVNLPVGIAGVFMVLKFVPAYKPTTRQRFDFLGAGMLFLSLFCFLFALTSSQELGFTNWLVIALFVIAVIAAFAFVRIELHTEQPLLDLRLFKNMSFSIGLITGLITFIAIAGTVFLMPFYLENVVGYDTRQVGLLLAAVPIVLVILSPISGTLSDRFGTRIISVIGLFLLMLGYAALTTLDTNTTAVGFLLRFLLVGIGMAVFQSPNNSAIMGASPRERLGIASGILAITRTLGQTTGIAMLGSIWAGLVLSAENSLSHGSLTSASPEVQVEALQITITILVFLIGFGLLLGIFAWQKERKAMKTGNHST